MLTPRTHCALLLATLTLNFQACTSRTEGAPKHTKALQAFIASQELKSQLGLPDATLAIMDHERNTASIIIQGGRRSVGMVYFVHDRGWYLPKPEQKLTHNPELNAWVIGD